MKHIYLLFSAICLLMSHQSFPQTLLHYWNFNNTNSMQEHLSSSMNIISVAEISHESGGISEVALTDGTGQNFSDENLNARNSDPAGNHLRFNDPIGGALIWSIPTTGYKDIVLKYATKRSGSGAGTQVITYTTDGTTYIPFFKNVFPVDGNPVLEILDFSQIEEVNDNPDFKIKIAFEQGSGGNKGNNRFDNITVEGNSVSGTDEVAPAVSFTPADNAGNIQVTVNPRIIFNEAIRLVDDTPIDNNNVGALIDFKINNESGTSVAFDAFISGQEITIIPSEDLQYNQKYYLALKENTVEDLHDNAIISTQSSVFTTIAAQTTFQPGDLVVVAYRMNTTVDDEIAILTLVDILPGTLVNITDAKYTSNTQAQCPNGLTWTAPQEGVAAGTVIIVKNDGPSVSIGNISGSKFGLSSDGDQVIIYTGEPASPSYITALSSNEWAASVTECKGSISQLPAQLQNNVTALSLNNVTGNVAGNTVNAYYHGPQSGNKEEIQEAVFNPANWTGTAKGTAPQQWPSWAFPGPPAVIAVSVVNQNTLQIVFSKDMDATATDQANYTGISDIQSVTKTDNGSLADTITLMYSTPFAMGITYELFISDVKDTEGLSMKGTYKYSFTYNTQVSLKSKFTSVKEGETVTLPLLLENPSTASLKIVVKESPFSTANTDDHTLTSYTLDFTGSSTSDQTITFTINDDQIEEQGEYLVISLEDPNGCTIKGSTYFTVFIQDNDRLAPQPTRDIELKHIGSFEPVSLDGSTTEIVVHDPETQKLFMTSGVQGRLDIADFSDPSDIKFIKSVDVSAYGGITSVAVKNGIVAIASPNANEQLDGSVLFFDMDGNFITKVTVGALPDMITFTPDGKKILTANEGQPNVSYTEDPEGSISVIDIAAGLSTLTQANVATLDFTAFNSMEASLTASGVRKTKSTSTLSQDLEPEYITVSSDSKKAWVTLQENNAIGEIDLTTNSITSIWALGTKDFSAVGSGFDASDKSGIVSICNWPIKGFYIPDGMASYSVGGTNYLVTANEGDEKEYGSFEERTTVAAVVLDPVVFPNAQVLKEEHNLGRLRISNLQGDKDKDGDYEELYMVGGRSFSIWNADTKQRVYDSGDDFEMITSTDPSVAAIFNCDNEDNDFKGRSRSKGPEPEGVTVAALGENIYAFVALERVGGVMVYDVTNPSDVKFVDYKNTRSVTSYSGDHGAEGIIFIAAENSPDGKPYIAVANEVSGTIAVFQIQSNVINSVNAINHDKHSLTLYPNPVMGTDVFLNKKVSGQILDIRGLPLINIDNTDTINISGFSKGMYFLKTNEGINIKFMVE